MKKLNTVILTAALVLAFGAMSAFAAVPHSGFADADGNGICGNYTGDNSCFQNGTHVNFVDANGDGICDNHAVDGSCARNEGHSGHGRHGSGRQMNFVDSDGDGRCDNYGTGCHRQNQ